MVHGTVHSRVIRLPLVSPYTAYITGYVSNRIYTRFSLCTMWLGSSDIVHDEPDCLVYEKGFKEKMNAQCVCVSIPE